MENSKSRIKKPKPKAKDSSPSKSKPSSSLKRSKNKNQDTENNRVSNSVNRSDANDSRNDKSKSLSKSLKKTGKKSEKIEGKSGVSLKSSVGDASGVSKGNKSLSRGRKNLSKSPNDDSSESKSKIKAGNKSNSNLLKSELLKDTTKDKIRMTEEEVNFHSKMANVKIEEPIDLAISEIKSFGFINAIGRVPRSKDLYFFGDDGQSLIINIEKKTAVTVNIGLESTIV